jgi:hypothetical protein
MKLTDYIDPEGGPTPFTVDGIDDTLYCQLLGVDDANEILGLVQIASESGRSSLTPFYVALLSRCVVRQNGDPMYDAKGWGRFKTKGAKVFAALVKKVQQMNGLLGEEESSELGKPSEQTGESDSSSSSA